MILYQKNKKYNLTGKYEGGVGWPEPAMKKPTQKKRKNAASSCNDAKVELRQREAPQGFTLNSRDSRVDGFLLKGILLPIGFT